MKCYLSTCSPGFYVNVHFMAFLSSLLCMWIFQPCFSRLLFVVLFSCKYKTAKLKNVHAYFLPTAENDVYQLVAIETLLQGASIILLTSTPLLTAQRYAMSF